MIKVVSVSLGSSRRDKAVKATLLGEEVEISRVGTDGDLKKAIQAIRNLDGKVDAIGLGGIDLFLWVGNQRFVVRDALKMARAAKVTPVVDGSGLKHTLEVRVVEQLAQDARFDLANKRAVLVSGIDRMGMAKALAKHAKEVMYGDLVFALKIPIGIRSYTTLKVLGYTLLPILSKLPFQFLYPVGEKQDEIVPKHGKLYAWGDVIAGDFHFIRRHMPDRMDGKIILTNTTTEEDVGLLKQRGVKYLVTTTPVFDGRSFGTNLLEAVFVTLLKKRPENVHPDDYHIMLNKLDFKPTVRELN
jgi:hypothetical protein